MIATVTKKNIDLSLRGLKRAAFLPADNSFCCVINPKAACSSVKFNIWKAEYEAGRTPWAPPVNKSGGAVHRPKDNPLLHLTDANFLPGMSTGPVFTVVRNPYTRLLSCYMDKIAGNKKEKKFLLFNLGLKENTDVSFEQFVRHVCEMDSREMDGHWAPQSFLTQRQNISYDFIGSVENLQEDIGKILTLIRLQENQEAYAYRPHGTSATEKLQRYYTDELIEAVVQRYADDFTLFGYSRAISEAGHPPTAVQQMGQPMARMSDEMRLIGETAAALATKSITQARQITQKYVAETQECSAEVAATIGEIYHLTGEQAESEHYLRAAVSKNPQVARYWLLLGQCMIKGEKFSETIEIAEHLLQIGPGRPPLLEFAANCYKLAGYPHRADELRANAIQFGSIQIS